MAKEQTKENTKDKAKDKAKDKPKEKVVSAPVGKGYIPRLRKIYNEKVALELKDEFGYTSSMQVPKFIKVVVSMGVGEAKENKKILDAAVGDVGIITGQKAVKTKARTSIIRMLLMVTVTIPWDLPSRSSFPRSTMTRSRR